MMQNAKENFLIAAIICIVTGAFLSVGGLYAMGGTIGISGIVLFLVGMTMTSQRSMTPEEIEHWQPSAEKMPDAGRVMFRVDVTLDEPIRSTILCGPCGHVTTVDGPKPVAFQCSKCERTLWDEEE
ncbi:MAG: hypothetical protein ACJZ63_05815 [Candidatus Poseidoniaceae archaeon]|tara:strand:+ start:1184 stop:1561 length:378 start_codon:yes stop_codon:yes gene_type:complete